MVKYPQLVFTTQMLEAIIIEWGERLMDKSKIIPIKLVLSPEKDGLIEIYRQNQLIDYQDVKYDDILD